MAIAALAGTKHLVLAGALSPVHFFAYPGVPGHPGARRLHGARARRAGGGRRRRAAGARRGGRGDPETLEAARPELPTGELTARSMSAVVGALLPEGAIVVDEALTSGVGLAEMTSGAPRHDWLSLTGGAIGDGLPMAAGAAIACPDRPVIGIQADGSAMYTISALWTYAREQLDITTIVCDNGSYAILERELPRVGAAGDGERAAQLLDLGGPDSTSSRSPPAWACRPAGPRPRRSWPISSGGRWPSPARTSSTQCSPGGADRGRAAPSGHGRRGTAGAAGPAEAAVPGRPETARTPMSAHADSFNPGVTATVQTWRGPVRAGCTRRPAARQGRLLRRHAA